ncbi:glycosyltransferase [Roseibium sp. MMSF_3544]|uniref:glycosyltransferase n=1 Tax=unclassified Roseibium TaxID=2629323 RepID=UPI00273DCFD2|nr:glycosyltransferase [Roseibium sp. MMSF_3544]
MRILMPCAAFPPFIDGGGPVSALLLAKLLKSEGHELRVVHVSDEEKREDYEGIPVQRKSSLNLYWNYYEPRPKWQKLAWHALENGNPRAYREMRKEIADYNPDIVLTDSIENINVATWAAARSLGVPVAHTIRSAFLLCWKGVMQKNGKPCEHQCLTCKVSALGKRRFSQQVDVVIGESNYILERHRTEGYFRNAEAVRIPGAIPALVAHEPLSFPTDRPFRIGFISVHTPFKGFDVLGKAAALIPEDANIEFVIAGTGRDAFAERARALFPPDRTTFTGWMKPEEFFPKIDLLAFPSVGREAFGRVAVEAFAHAVPVVGSDLGGISETVQPDRNGLLVVPGNPELLQEALLRIAGDPDRFGRLSAGALQSAQLYKADKIASAYTDALSLAIRRRQVAA